MPRTILIFFLLVVFIAFAGTSAAQPQSPKVLNAAELRLAIKKLGVLGSVLFIAAHPDDENTAFLAYMAKGRLMRSAYLSVTRGEGGQNLLGAEQGDLMGVIRTQELLAARRIDGAEQYFTRAIDFGYSKTLEESMRIWGKERVLSDVVWVIRSYRPDVVVMRFTPTQGGHGNHTSSAALTEEAYAAAGDPLRFPEQLKYVQIWKPKRLLWNVFRFQQTDRPSKPDSAVTLDLGTYSPVLGESFTEIAGRSRSMHKSQGFGAGQNRGEFINYFQHVSGEMAQADIFDGINTTWSRIKGGEGVSKFLEDAYRTFDEENPAKSLPSLLRAYGEMEKLKTDSWTQVKKSELVEVIKLCGGLWLDALSSDNFGPPGVDIRITASALNRSSYLFRLIKVAGPFGRFDTTLTVQLQGNQQVQVPFTLKLPKEVPYSQPYWLIEPAELGAYRLPQQQLVGRPENAPALSVSMTLGSNDGVITVDVPVRFRAVDPVEGEQYRPFGVIPPIALNLPEKIYVFADGKSHSVQVNIRGNVASASGAVALRTPDGWKVTPPSVPFDLRQKDENLSVSFQVEPTVRSASGSFGVVATVGDVRVHQDMITIRYPHIPPQTVFPEAEGKLLRIDLKKTDRRIGYIMGAGDDIPVALRQMGYSVTLLTDEDLKNGNLSQYDVILTGVRAYNTRPVLKANQRKLMEFVESGGTYVVQYMTARRAETDNLGPYPFNVTSDRVSVEEATVRFLAPDHPVLNSPNKITQADFDGWIQERGLYFADKWDARYTAILGSNDPGEPSRDGGLLVAQYGKGSYVFTGYAFFRQLPAGVLGAYRLFVNLISLGSLK
jgi:LmbE family N-acetylglucosaminyl deacetylase